MADGPLSSRPTGLILAGGLGRRMGGVDKALLPLRGRPLAAHVAERLRPQVGRLLLNANGDGGRFSALGLPVVADPVPDHPGPLAGVLAGLDVVAGAESTDAVLITVPADCPFLPRDLVARLMARQQETGGIVCARSGERVHPVVAAWPLAVRDLLRAYLASGGRRLMEVFDQSGGITVAWPTTPWDPFFNINAPQDLAAAETYLSAAG